MSPCTELCIDGIFCLMKKPPKKKMRLGFHIVLLGQVAAGKDTQAGFLMNDFALTPVESGKYWRTLAKAKTKEGELLRKTTGKGLPAPVSLMKKFLIEQISKRPLSKDLIFIGNPRLKPEAQLLKKVLENKKEKFCVIYITLPDKEIIKRSSLRKRDALDVVYIKNRILWHKNQVTKTVSYFDTLGLLKKVSGIGTQEKVRKDVLKNIIYFQKKFSLKK